MNLIRNDAVRSWTVDQNIDSGTVARAGHRKRKFKYRELLGRLIENNYL